MAYRLNGICSKCGIIGEADFGFGGRMTIVPYYWVPALLIKQEKVITKDICNPKYHKGAHRFYNDPALYKGKQDLFFDEKHALQYGLSTEKNYCPSCKNFEMDFEPFLEMD